MPNNGSISEQYSPSHERDFARAAALLREAFGRHAAVEWHLASDSDHGADIVVKPRGGSTRHYIQLKYIGSALPKSSPGDAADTTLVWVLRRAPARLRKELRDRLASYVDLAGAVHLELPWAIVDREKLQAPPEYAGHSKGSVDPWGDKSSLVMRVMLASDQSRTWQIRELAEEARIGVATASDTVRALADRDLLTVTRRGRSSSVSMTDPRKAFDAWTQAYSWRLNQSVAVQVPMGDPVRFLKRLPSLFEGALPKDMRWALTLQAGASLVAPHATWERVYVYLDLPQTRGLRVLKKLLALGDWQTSRGGRLVLMVPYYSVSVWYGMRNVNGLPVVSDLQLALDLWHYPLRGREQAEHLLDRAIRTKAQPTFDHE